MSTTEIQPRSRNNPSEKPKERLGAPTLVLLGFAAVYLIWGSTYFAIRVGVESVPPLLLAGMRHLGFGLMFYPILRWKSAVKPTWEVLALVCGKWRGLRGGADRAVRSYSASGGYRLPVDGDCGLVATWGCATGATGSSGTGIGICRIGFTRRSEELGRIGSRQPWGRGALTGSFFCLVLRIFVFKTWGSSFAAFGSGDAEPVRRSDLGCGGIFHRGSSVLPSCGGDWAILGGSGIPCVFWVDDGVHGIRLYLEEEHCHSRGDVRLRESGCRTAAWVAFRG
jgi:hypothetical protein